MATDTQLGCTLKENWGIPQSIVRPIRWRLLYKNSTGPTLISMLIAAFLCWYLRQGTEPKTSRCA